MNIGLLSIMCVGFFFWSSVHIVGVETELHMVYEASYPLGGAVA